MALVRSFLVENVWGRSSASKHVLEGIEGAFPATAVQERQHNYTSSTSKLRMRDCTC